MLRPYLAGVLTAGMLAVYLWPEPPPPPPRPAPAQCTAQQHIDWWFNGDPTKQRKALARVCKAVVK